MDHDKTSVHAYLKSDLKASKGVSLEVFLEIVLGLTPATLNEWVSIIREQQWYKDRVIRVGLRDFCRTGGEEDDRYKPLAAITNRVMAMARGKLPGVPKAYPIDDICVIRNDPKPMRRIAAHGELGAMRKPDLLTLRKVHAANHDRKGKQSGIEWVQDIINWELKGIKSLSGPLKQFLEDRKKGMTMKQGATPSGSNVPEQSAATPATKLTKARTNKRRSTRRPQQQRPTVPVPAVEPSATAPDIPVHAGKKRPAEHNLLNDIRRATNPFSGDLDRFGSTDASSFAAKEASIQVGSYALETLACTFGTRLFCLNIAVENDRLNFWYYDACGFICTIERISLVDDFEKVAAIFVGFACCTPERLGALPAIFEPPSSAPYPANWPPKNLSDHTIMLRRPGGRSRVKITFQEPVFTQYALCGRRTFVYTIKGVPSLSKNELIIKLSYQVKTRKKEQALVKRARKAGVGHMPEIHLWKTSDGIRSAFFEKAGVEYEDRILRAIVYTRYLPLQALFPHSPESIIEMAHQIIECLYELHEKAQILHRDISLHNVMHEYRDTKLYFVLIDFDMATIVSTEDDEPYTPSSKQRTGTLPFMAVELIANAADAGSEGYVPLAHLVRHDVESNYWLSLWCPMVFMEPKSTVERIQKDKNVDVVRAWETARLEQIADTKTNIRRRCLDVSRITLIGRASCLQPWFDAWERFWVDIDAVMERQKRAAAMARRNHNYGKDKEPFVFENETVNGLFTRDRLMKILNEARPLVNQFLEEWDAMMAGGKEAGPSTEPPLVSPVTEGDVAGTRKQKIPAAMTKPAVPSKAKATRKTSTARKIAAAEKVKPTPRRAATRAGKTRAAAKSAEVDKEHRNMGDDDVRRRLRPRKQVNYKI